MAAERVRAEAAKARETARQAGTDAARVEQAGEAIDQADARYQRAIAEGNRMAMNPASATLSRGEQEVVHQQAVAATTQNVVASNHDGVTQVNQAMAQSADANRVTPAQPPIDKRPPNLDYDSENSDAGASVGVYLSLDANHPWATAGWEGALVADKNGVGVVQTETGGVAVGPPGASASIGGLISSAREEELAGRSYSAEGDLHVGGGFEGGRAVTEDGQNVTMNGGVGLGVGADLSAEMEEAEYHRWFEWADLLPWE